MNLKNKNWLLSTVAMGIVFLSINGCKKEDSTSNNGPTITTNSITNITTKTATGGGNITSDGGKEIQGKGICWSTTQNPTVSNSNTFDGVGTGAFSSNLTNLKANTTYYVRAYARNSSEVWYGNQVSFKTPATGSNSLSATVDGSPYTAINFNVLSSNGEIGISGMNGSKNMLIWLPDPFTTGSHALSGAGADYKCQYAPTLTTVFTSTSGTLNITGEDGTSSISVTSGTFEVYK